MKKAILLLSVIALCLSVQVHAQRAAYEIMGRDSICRIFLFSPEGADGLHLAYLTDDSKWQDAGRICSSDYLRAGKGGRIYDPYVVHAGDDTWRLLFALDDSLSCLGAAYSEDLLVWRPQEFPHLLQKGVREPIMFQMDDGTFDIYYKTKAGSRHYVQADKDFRKFSELPGSSTIDDVAWLRDTATIGGYRYKGNQFDVPKLHLDYALAYLRALAEETELCRETMRDDAKRFATVGSMANATLKVDISGVKRISDKMVGVSIEDDNHAAGGGLYAECLQNRDFECSAGHRPEPSATGWQSNRPIVVRSELPLSKNNPHYAVLAAGDTLYNKGWGGIAAAPDQAFTFSVWLRNEHAEKNQVTVALVGDRGVVAKSKINVEGQGWNRYSARLCVDKKAVGEHVRLAITPRKSGGVCVDMVSLFPEETFQGHGLRTDLAEAIAALHPKFVRFFGGCVSCDGQHGVYRWSDCAGPWQHRRPAVDCRGEHQSGGMGCFEYFQFCEDIGAEPLPVVAVGAPGQPCAYEYARDAQQGGIAMKDMPAYCQDVLALVEWANGDPAASSWAKMRADAGHPAPFNLKYIAVGHHQAFSTAFQERYELLCRTIKQKYPDIVVCGTAGASHMPSVESAEGWKFAKTHRPLVNMVDEQVYKPAGWLMHHQDDYDSYDRTNPKLSHTVWSSCTPTHEGALAEAMFLCGMERNADVVMMTAYAPLLSHEKYAGRRPSLIAFNNDSITTLTPSYHVQRLWGTYSGNECFKSNIDIRPELRHRVAASVVRAAHKDKIYLKVVNALPCRLAMNVEGLTLPASGMTYEGFSGKITDKKVHIEKNKTDGTSILLPPYTIRIFELPTTPSVAARNNAR